MDFVTLEAMEQTAKDGAMEYIELKGLKVSELKSEITSPRNNFTDSFIYTAAMMLARYKDIKKL